MPICPFETKVECDCFFALLELDPTDTESYARFLDEESVMKFYASGEWHGRDGIVEYMSSFGGPLATQLELISDISYDFSESTEEQCAAILTFVGRTVTKAPENPVCFDFSSGSVLTYTLTDNPDSRIAIKNWNVWMDQDFSLLAVALDEPSSAEFVCNAIVNDCDGYSLDGNFTGAKGNQTMEQCLETYEQLPTTNLGDYVDGNSRGCRIVHSMYVKQNRDHCPHVSFEKEIDKNGLYKCYESKGLVPEDVFTEQQLAFMRSKRLPYASDNPFVAMHPVGSCPAVDTSTAEIETFPIVFGTVMIGLALIFTVWILSKESLNAFGTRETKKKSDDSASTKDQLQSVIDVDNEINENHTGGGELRSSFLSFKNAWAPTASFTNSLSNESSPQVSQHGESRFLLSWKGLSCSYPPKKHHTEPIFGLRDASGAIQANEFVAIMGPSGAGKTTLLDILSGRKTVGNLKGEMSALGSPIKDTDLKHGVAKLMKNVAAYVPQQEEFFPMQTPTEAVSFFVNMRLGQNTMTVEDIHSMLQNVGLEADTWDRPIGGNQAGGIVVRGLSGGERKRLALACALALKPSILFLDEITSGLDSENSLLVTKVLKRACTLLSTTVILVVHQPGLRMFQMFDRLILMSQRGTCIYCGKTSNIPAFYENQLHKRMPELYDVPIDLLSESAMVDMSITEGFVLHQTMPVTAPLFAADSWFFQFRNIFLRNLTNHYLRNITNLASRLVIYIVTSAVTGLVFWKSGTVLSETLAHDSAVDVFSLVGAGVFLEQTAFMLPIAQVSTFFFDKKVYAAEKALGLYPSWMYALTQFLLEAWVVAMATMLQAAVAVPMISLWNPELSKVESFFQLISFFLASGLSGNAFVLFFSMICFSQDLALLLSAAFFVISFATSGAYVSFDNMEPWIRWLQWISPMKYSIQIYLMCLFKGTPSLETAIERLDFDVPSTISANLGVLMAMFCFLSTATVLLLSVQKEAR